MKNRRNYYRILHVQPDAPQAVIRASYKALMLELKQHPDLGGEHWNATVLNEAFETLSSSEERAQYDRQLFEHYTKTAFPTDRKNPIISYFCPFCKRPLARKAQPDETCTSCRSPLVSDNAYNPAQNQRAIERVRKSGRIRFYRDLPHKPAMGEIVDLSPHGMCFQCRERLAPKMTIKISNNDLSAVAVVVHARKVIGRDRTDYIVGTKFLSVKFHQTKGNFHSTYA